MGNLYSQEEREEALKLADEIGTAAAAGRLGINVDTLEGDDHIALQQQGQPQLFLALPLISPL